MKKEAIQLSDHFDYGRLLRFTYPTILMLVFTGIYGVVDGLFVSNFVGKTAFAAVNLIMPFLMLPAAIAFMIGSGGTALVAKTMGEGDDDRAKRLFTMMFWLTIIIGLILTIINMLLLEPVAKAFGAEGEILDYCLRYGRIIVLGSTTFLVQFMFQPFFVAAEKPMLGMWVTIIAGVTNMIGDAVLVGVMKWGVEGAAVASILSQFVGGAIPTVYFARKNTSRLRLTSPEWDVQSIIKTCTNGSSEMVTNISMSLVNILYNVQLMERVGEDGVAAYGVIMYASMIFIYIFIGYSVGMTPIVGYHYGAQNQEELHNLLKRSIMLSAMFGIVLTAIAEIFGKQIAQIFVGFDDNLWEMTTRALRIYGISFLIAPLNILASAYFTALNNGLVSAVISFSRTFVLQIISILLLPVIIGLDGIWFATVTAESLSLIVSIVCFAVNRNKYGY